MRIKRESWAGHYRIVARNKKGQLVTHSKWTRQFNVAAAKTTFQNRGTLRKDIKIEKTKLTNVTETNIYGSKSVPAKAERYQYFISGVINFNNRQNKVFASSKMYDRDYPVSEARKEAYDNFYMRASADVFGERYDSELGELEIMSLDRRDVFIDEGVRFYNANISTATNKAAA